jgi:hypothetical protein
MRRLLFLVAIPLLFDACVAAGLAASGASEPPASHPPDQTYKAAIVQHAAPDRRVSWQRQVACANVLAIATRARLAQ